MEHQSMTEGNGSMWVALVKAATWGAAWFGTIKLADVQVMVSIISGIIVGGLALLNLIVTWRDKFRRKS
jgi:hypothetical protein